MIERIKITELITLEVRTRKTGLSTVITEAKGLVEGEYTEFEDYHLVLNRLENTKGSRSTIENTHRRIMKIMKDIVIRQIKDFYNVEELDSAAQD